jgi:hypothetical protein
MGIADDNIIQIGARVDLSGLQSGMSEASTVVSSATASMEEKFAKLGQSTQKSSSAFEAVAQKAIILATAEGRLSAAQTVLNATLEKSVVSGKATEEETRAIATAMLEMESIAKQVAVAQKELSAAQEEAGIAAGVNKQEIQEASHAAQEFGTLTGIHIPRALRTMIGSLEGIGPLIASSFSILAAVAFVEIIDQGIDKIKEASQALAGFDAEAKKAYDNALKVNQQFYLQQVKTTEEHIRFNEIGLSGLKKLDQQQKDAKESAKLYADELGENLRQVRGLVAEKDHLQKDWGPLFNPLNWATLGDQVKEVEARITAVNSAGEKLEERLRALRDEKGAQVPAETKKVTADEERSLDEARLEANKSTELAIVAQKEAALRLSYQAGKISLEQEIQGLEAAENRKYEILQQAFARKIALLRAEQAATGEFKEPEILSTQAQQKAETLAHPIKVQEIRQTGTNEEERQANANALADAQARKLAADTEVAIAEQSARQLYSLHQISLDQEVEQLKEAERKKSAARLAELNEEFRIANQHPEQNTAKLTTINSQIEAEEKNSQARITAIDQQAELQRMEQRKQMEAERLQAAERSASSELQITESMNNARLRRGEETLRQWEQTELAAINRWYEEQKRVLEQELEFAAATFGKQSLEYQKMLDRMNQLDQQRAAKQQQIEDTVAEKRKSSYDKFTAQFNSDILQMLQRQKTFGQVLIDSWDYIVSQIITKMLKMMEEWIYVHIIMKMFGLNDDDGTAKAKKKIKNNVAVAQSEAALAGAEEFEWKIAESGDIFSAAAFGAAAYAIGAGFAGMAGAAMPSAAGGWERVPSDTLAMVHKDEQILPASYAEGLRGLVAGGGKGGGGKAFHYHDNSNYSGLGTSEFGDKLEEHRDTLRHMFQGMVNRGEVGMGALG